MCFCSRHAVQNHRKSSMRATTSVVRYIGSRNSTKACPDESAEKSRVHWYRNHAEQAATVCRRISRRVSHRRSRSSLFLEVSSASAIENFWCCCKVPPESRSTVSTERERLHRTAGTCIELRIVRIDDPGKVADINENQAATGVLSDSSQWPCCPGVPDKPHRSIS
jgi:hypothetical protein